MRSKRLLPRGSLFIKYFVTLFIVVVVPLIFGAVGEAWFGYRDQWRRLDEVLQAEARSAAGKIQAFTDGIRDQLGWVVQFPWTQDEDDRHRIDPLRLLNRCPRSLRSLWWTKPELNASSHPDCVSTGSVGAWTCRQIPPSLARAPTKSGTVLFDISVTPSLT